MNMSFSRFKQGTCAPMNSKGKQVEAGVRLLREGRLVCFPTETVYGLGADASNPNAVEQIFELKGRPANHPLIVHLGNADQINSWAEDIPSLAWKLAECFWPGPLTLILKKAPNVPQQVTGGQDTIGLRVPAHPLALKLLTAFGGGVAAPSANRFGRISPTRAEHVLEEFGEELDMVLDGGKCQVGLESTILDLSTEHPVLLRPGSITRTQLAGVLGEPPKFMVVGKTDIRAPGLLPSHYAPQTPLELVKTDQLKKRLRELNELNLRTGLIVLSRVTADVYNRVLNEIIEMPSNANSYARNLYASMRFLDRGGFDRILVEAPPESNIWSAIHNRLHRAAHKTKTGVTVNERCS